MAEDPNTPVPQSVTPNGTDPTTATVTPPVASETPATAPTTTDTSKEIEDLKAALKKANAEAASHRHKANELDKLKAEQEAATLSTQQKLEKQLTALQAEHDNATRQLQETRINAAVQLHAIQQGIDPKLAQKLLDQSALEFDDTGNPTNMDAAFKAMLKEFNITGKTAAPTSGGATNPPRSQTDSSGEITEEFAMGVLSGKIANPTADQRAKVSQWLVAQQYGFSKPRR